MGWENNKAQGDMVQARELFLLNGIWSGVEWSGEWSGVVVWEEEEGANGIFLFFFLSVFGTPIAPKSCKNELWMKFIVIQKSKLKNPIPNILHQHRPTGPNWSKGRGPLLFFPSFSLPFFAFLCLCYLFDVLPWSTKHLITSYSANAMADYYIKASQAKPTGFASA